MEGARVIAGHRHIEMVIIRCAAATMLPCCDQPAVAFAASPHLMALPVGHHEFVLRITHHQIDVLGLAVKYQIALLPWHEDAIDTWHPIDHHRPCGIIHTFRRLKPRCSLEQGLRIDIPCLIEVLHPPDAASTLRPSTVRIPMSTALH